MSARLTCNEVAVLNNLKNTVSPTASENSTALNRLFMYGLAARQPSGKVIVTKSGERFLFQKDCCAVLRALSQNEASTPPSSVTEWLKAAAFVTEVGSAQTLKITKRGELWLASFDLEGPTDVGDTYRVPSKLRLVAAASYAFGTATPLGGHAASSARNGVLFPLCRTPIRSCLNSRLGRDRDKSATRALPAAHRCCKIGRK